ncbi:MAG TPA: SGNH/GDSL hydrolase family protein [Planctomycetota bacterium]|nr:SGNH/GDSL hydrolase family protein [Planctomycetota bacterium]
MKHVIPVVLALLAFSGFAADDEWVAAMKEVHAKKKGTKGSVSQIGDSITYTKAFLSGVGWALKTPEWKTLTDRVDANALNNRKGPEHNNYSGWTAGDGLSKIKNTLANEKPEIAVIMYGTNDVTKGVAAAEYEKNMTAIVDACIEAGCVPIVSTIPPYVNKEQQAVALNDVVKKIAKAKKIPLVDFHAAVLEKQPGQAWDGTLLGKGDVHPTGGDNFNFAEDNLKKCGYALRNYVTLKVMQQVIEKCF